jgi:hypothetical protein
MTINAAIDVDIVYHDASGQTFTVGAVTDHLRGTTGTAYTLTGTAGTSATTLTAAGSLSTLAIKNTGTNVLRVAGAIDVSAGRLAVLPVTATVSVSAPSGSTQYTAVWLG